MCLARRFRLGRRQQRVALRPDPQRYERMVAGGAAFGGEFYSKAELAGRVTGPTENRHLGRSRGDLFQKINERTCSNAFWILFQINGLNHYKLF